MNCITLLGRMVADPELKTTQSGISVCSFRIAVDRDFTAKGEKRQSDFIPCVAWRQTGEFVSKYFSKGKTIALRGSLQTRAYEDKGGNKRTAYEVVADKVYFAGDKGTEQSVPSQPQQGQFAVLPHSGGADDFYANDGDLLF